MSHRLRAVTGPLRSRSLGAAFGILLGLAAGLAPAALQARVLWRRGEVALDFTGSLREVFTVGNGTEADDFAEAAAESPALCGFAASFARCPAFGEVGDADVAESLTRLRLRLDLQWGSRLSAALAYDNELRLGNLATLGDALADTGDTDTFLGLEHEISSLGFEERGRHRRWRHRAYRAHVRYEGEHLELTVGRQRIPWGVGRLWNPIDRFNAIPPLAIEQDQSPGIDAVDARWRLSGFSYVQAVYAPGTRSSDSRYAVRFAGVVRDVDVSLVAGVFEEARSFGFDLAGNLGGAAVRLEAVYTNPEQEIWPVGAPRPEELDRYWQIVLSADTNIDVGSGIYLLAEHLYNGNALGFGKGEAGVLLPFFESAPPLPGAPSSLPGVRPASNAVFGGSRVITGARHTSGLQVGYDLGSALRADLLVLYDWNGESAVLAPSFAFTGLNAVDLTVGAQFFAGGRRSQYGAQDPLVFALLELYF